MTVYRYRIDYFSRGYEGSSSYHNLCHAHLADTLRQNHIKGAAAVMAAGLEPLKCSRCPYYGEDAEKPRVSFSVISLTDPPSVHMSLNTLTLETVPNSKKNKTLPQPRSKKSLKKTLRSAIKLIRGSCKNLSYMCECLELPGPQRRPPCRLARKYRKWLKRYAPDKRPT